MNISETSTTEVLHEQQVEEAMKDKANVEELLKKTFEQDGNEREMMIR